MPNIIHSYKEYPSNLIELFNKFVEIFQNYENYIISDVAEILSDGTISVVEIGPRIGLSTRFKYSLLKFSVKFDIVKGLLDIHFSGNKVASKQFKNPIIRCVNKAIDIINQHLDYLEGESGPKTTCLVCRKEIPSNSKFCSECGAETITKQICFACGVQLPRYCKFCNTCGAKLD